MFFPAILTLFSLQKIIYALKNYRLEPKKYKSLEIDKVPSVTVCIPARNETNQMTTCLEALLRSDYPKLEIVVLDDNSVDNTSILVKSFAHSGVRFIHSDPLPHGWIGRNYAYQNLLNSANGEYIFFLSVDNIVTTTTISRVMSYKRQKKAEMISVMPNIVSGFSFRTIFSTMRYFLILVLSTKKKPAVASGAWIVDREQLKKHSVKFEKYKDDLFIEQKIARVFSVKNRYHFLISSRSNPLLSSDKSWRNQVETSIRLYAMGLGGNILREFLEVIGQLIFLLPFIMTVLSLVAGQWRFLNIVFAVILALQMVSYGIFVSFSRRHGVILSVLLSPLVFLQEFIVLIVAIAKRHFGTIVWKGRKIIDNK